MHQQPRRLGHVNQQPCTVVRQQTRIVVDQTSIVSQQMGIVGDDP
jgi:hypothetical protein